MRPAAGTPENAPRPHNTLSPHLYCRCSRRCVSSALRADDCPLRARLFRGRLLMTLCCASMVRLLKIGAFIRRVGRLIRCCCRWATGFCWLRFMNGGCLRLIPRRSNTRPANLSGILPIVRLRRSLLPIGWSTMLGERSRLALRLTAKAVVLIYSFRTRRISGTFLHDRRRPRNDVIDERIPPGEVP